MDYEDVTMSSWKQVLEAQFQLVVVILSEDIRGSEVKQRVTKYLQGEKAGKKACLIQCLNQGNTSNPSAMNGAFDDICAKIGNNLFEIKPRLFNDKKYIDVEKTWCVGVELSHVKSNPSVAMLCLNTKPMIGSIQHSYFSAHVMPRKDVISFEGMIGMFLNVLTNAHLSKAFQKNAPSNIIVFRGGLPDNRFGEVYSKEIVAIQRAVKLFTQRVGQKDETVRKWKPKINFLVVNKSIIDRFGVCEESQHGREFSYRSVAAPCVIVDEITSYRLFDFILWPYHPKKQENKTKPVRYIVLKDDMKLASDPNACVDLFQFIYSLCYCFVFGIPFPLGNTANPSVLVYAKRYAESFGQMIFETDRTVKDLKRSSALSHRPQLADPVGLSSSETD